MSEVTLRELVKQTLEYADDFCTFVFQGGEPTLVGLDFYRKFVEFQKLYNYKKVKINNSLQTNGVLIDEAWAKFLAEQQFLVGLSLDGPQVVHDQYRVDASRKGTYDRVMQTVQLFNQFQVAYNILFVVNEQVAREVEQIYQFFKKNDFRYLQFIACLDPLDENPGKNKYSLTPQLYTDFLKKLFDLWYRDLKQNHLISMREFENYITMAMGYPPESCGMSGTCTCYFVIEGDGSVYPCDFYVLDQWRMGNIQTHTFKQLAESKVGKEFVAVSRYIDPKCKACRWYTLCRGGCRRWREPFVDGKPSLNQLCHAYYEFFEYAGERIFELARILSKRG